MRQFYPGEIVRHFKRETVDQAAKDYLYQIIGIAFHSETGEEMMVYRALYGDQKMYVRPLDMFMDKTDKEKYPDIQQEYRFESVGEEHDG